MDFLAQVGGLPQIRCLCCGLDYRGFHEAITHHDKNRAYCLQEREKRMRRLKGANPAMPAVIEFLRGCSINATVLENLANTDPKWLKHITGARLAWSMKEKIIRKGAVDPAFALVSMDPLMADAITSLELLAKGLEPDEAEQAWAMFYKTHLGE